jgi:Zn-finger nucleic acid-binding protein
MKCAQCDVDLVMSERQGVEIDYCPKCRGVWLDRGELDKIIERSMQSAPAQAQAAPGGYPPGVQPQNVQQPPMNSDDSHYGYPYKRKKSWLGEIFD